MSTILPTLEHVNKLTEIEHKIGLLRNLYLSNVKFKKCMDYCYTANPYITVAPSYIEDDSPAGLNHSSMEKSLDKFIQAVYSNGIKDELRNKMLTQVFESVNPFEAKLMKEVMTGECRQFPKDVWMEYQNADV